MTALTIHRLDEFDATPDFTAALDAIFFASSNTKSFASETARVAFRERWLGRYITRDAGWFYVSLDPLGRVAGYLAGCLDDPAESRRFSDFTYYWDFRELTRRFPAHLHINFAPEWRGHGAGSELIQAFTRDAAAAGSSGVHVVTSRAARNVGFYNRNGFTERGAVGKGEKEIVFLARDLLERET